MKNLHRLLQKVQDGTLSVEEAASRLKFLPFEGMDNVLFDHHRQMRKGFPEVIYGRGKTADQLKRVLPVLLERQVPILITRAGLPMAQELLDEFPDLNYDPVANAIYFPKEEKGPHASREEADVLIITAGTSDLPLAREASLTLRLMEIAYKTLVDVGVAGLHRLFGHLELIEKAAVIICIAGMEGALPSIVAGIAASPVIAVPTSTGYGSNLNGIVPLLAMLNSCAPGIGVVNIDNGFGAASLAASIIWSITRSQKA